MEGWDGGVGGRPKGEGAYVYMIHFGVQQKKTQHCKATIIPTKQNPTHSVGMETKSCRSAYTETHIHTEISVL